VTVISNVDDKRKALALGADAYRAPPVPEDWLLATLRRRTARTDRRVLVVDDDDASLCVMRELSSPDAEAALADALRRPCAVPGQPAIEALGLGGGS
jgi:hypothetical protein